MKWERVQSGCHYYMCDQCSYFTNNKSNNSISQHGDIQCVDIQHDDNQHDIYIYIYTKEKSFTKKKSFIKEKEKNSFSSLQENQQSISESNNVEKNNTEFEEFYKKIS